MRFTNGLGIGTAAAFAVVMGCSSDTTRTAGTAQTTVSLSQVASPAASAAASFSVEDGDSGHPGFIRRMWVDSLLVTVTQVQVLPESLLAHRHHGEHWGGRGWEGGLPTGPLWHGGHGDGPWGIRDSLRLRDSTQLRDSLGWGGLSEDWYTLDVSGSGRLDLMHLPTDTGSGLVLAVGTVPAGDYVRARLVVGDAFIWFDTTFTVGGTTFTEDTPYPVTIPSGTETGIKTRDGFTIVEGASEVELLFDAEEAIRALIVKGDGTLLLVPPRIRHRMHHH
jgi:hypothetical protein